MYVYIGSEEKKAGSLTGMGLKEGSLIFENSVASQSTPSHTPAYLLTSLLSWGSRVLPCHHQEAVLPRLVRREQRGQWELSTVQLQMDVG